MNYDLSFDEKNMCRKIGSVFELAAQAGCFPPEAVKKWCLSQTAQGIYELNESLICQSKLYIFHDFQREGLPCNITTDIEEDLMYWAGYIITYASFALRLSPKQLFSAYDLVSFIGSYDVLHTLSSDRMTEELVTQYDILKNTKSKLWGE